ncbi:MAG: DUF928 domain-containing protein [Nitrospirae bacterium]|nr:DUF928 domain-containing protein [Nitrospirota bacterium]
MKIFLNQEPALVTALLLVAAISFPYYSVAAQSTTPSPPQELRSQAAPAGSMVAVPVYKPPVRGAPGGRVGGGTRGTGDQTFTLSVLAPNHTALTIQEQPVLYWFVSRPITTPIVFTLSDNGVKPLVEQTLTPPFEKGIHRLNLADYGAKLAAGKQYRWFVSLVSDSKRRSRDVLAGATIERTNGLAPAGQLDPMAQARQYADAGQWYDAIAVLSDLIEGNPSEGTYRRQRAGLLQQVGLIDIAEYDLARPNE